MILSLFYGLRMPWIGARGQGVRPRKVTKVTPTHVFRGSQHCGRQGGGIGHQRRAAPADSESRGVGEAGRVGQFVSWNVQHGCMCSYIKGADVETASIPRNAIRSCVSVASTLPPQLGCSRCEAGPSSTTVSITVRCGRSRMAGWSRSRWRWSGRSATAHAA